MSCQDYVVAFHLSPYSTLLPEFSLKYMWHCESLTSGDASLYIISKFHYMTFKAIWNLISCSFSPECLPLSCSPDEHLFCLCCVPTMRTVLLLCLFQLLVHSHHLCANTVPRPSYLKIVFDLINSIWALRLPFLGSVACSISMAYEYNMVL